MKTPRILTPDACTTHELREFERLVREGFAGSDAGLPGRMRTARLLAFQGDDDGSVVAIAGLKTPGADHTRAVFALAEADADPADVTHELGWVYTLPARRRQGLGIALCRGILAATPRTDVYATARADNAGMIGILAALDFVRTGQLYRRRDTDMTLHVRRAGSAARPREKG